MYSQHLENYCYAALMVVLWFVILYAIGYLPSKWSKSPRTGGAGVDGLFSLTTILTILISFLVWKVFHWRQ